MKPTRNSLVVIFFWVNILQGSRAIRQHSIRTKAANRDGKRMDPRINLEVVGERQGLMLSEQQSKIPHILHYIYLSGFNKFVAETEVPRARMQKKYYDSCVAVHSYWEVKFWTQEMAEDLIRSKYAWFLPVWESYDMEVKRADAIRPFILHHYGGLYLDLDNECFEPAEKLFGQHDAILQGSGWEGVNNGMMASAPGHPLWLTLVEILKERHTGSEAEPLKNLPLYMTGPSVLAEAVKRYLQLPAPMSGFINKEYAVDNLVVKVYCLGEFFMPCWQSDVVCQKQLEKGMAAGTWDITNIVGRHWFASTWNKPELLFGNKKPHPLPHGTNIVSANSK